MRTDDDLRRQAKIDGFAAMQVWTGGLRGVKYFASAGGRPMSREEFADFVERRCFIRLRKDERFSALGRGEM